MDWFVCCTRVIVIPIRLVEHVFETIAQSSRFTQNRSIVDSIYRKQPTSIESIFIFIFLELSLSDSKEKEREREEYFI